MYIGIVRVVIEAILEAAHKDVLRQNESASQVLKLLGVLGSTSASLFECDLRFSSLPMGL